MERSLRSYGSRPYAGTRYAVAYRIDAAQVTVVAVYHLGSDPSRWQSRA
jgi:hypothetical protein